jgi:hypothetical protein
MTASAKWITTAITVSLAMAGCAADNSVETAALAATPVPSGKARVTISREQTLVYAGCPASVSRGTAKVAEVANGGRAVFDIPPGDTVLSVSCWSYPGDYKVSFKAEPGRIYDMQVAPRQASVGTAVLLGSIGGAIEASSGENTGAFEIKAAAATAAFAAPAVPATAAAAKPAATNPAAPKAAAKAPN